MSDGPERCPSCGEPLWMCEVSGVYDGGLYMECPKCHARTHRWPEGDRRRTLAEPYVKGVSR